MVNLIQIKNIRNYIDNNTCHTLVRSLALSYLDYCISIPASLPKKSINVMQCIQHIVSKMILNKKTKDSATACLKNYTGCPFNKELTLKYLYSYSNHSTSRPQTIYKNLSRKNKEEKA